MQEYMKQALRIAEESNRVKIGAVLIRDGETVGTGYSSSFLKADPTSHAEIAAIRDACHSLDTDTLTDCVLYTTLEPNLMSAAAISWARIPKVVFGARAAKAPSDYYEIKNYSLRTVVHNFNHRFEVAGPVMERESVDLLFNSF